MVFNDNNNSSTHHNKLNLRDRSIEPGNLFGDRNLYSTQNDNNNEDINDREDDSDDLPPPLE